MPRASGPFPREEKPELIYARSGLLSQDQVGERASAIARARARSDVTAEVARRVSLEISPSRTADVSHEMDALSGARQAFHMRHVQERYESELGTGLASLEARAVAPTPLEETVARLVVAAEREADGSDIDRGLSTLASVLEGVPIDCGEQDEVSGFPKLEVGNEPELADSFGEYARCRIQLSRGEGVSRVRQQLRH